MFKVLLLVCASSVAPGDCQSDTAIDLIHGPLVKNELLCGMHGQAFLAQTALPPRAGEYLKIKCERIK